jgi:predicted dehydrogenase
MVGLGKMGLSHHAIARAHPDVTVVAACDQLGYLTSVLTKYTGLTCYDDYDRLLASEALDAVIIATPSRFHATMVEKALERGLHVFCEKPFVLDVADGERLVALAETKALVNQVGYHFRFVGAFQEAARIVKSGALGEVHHVRVEAYGPVVLRPEGITWRSAKSEGGGALYDYACHALDLVNFVAGPPASVGGVVLKSIYSRDVDDEVYCTLTYPNGATGQMAVNWSDESYRKMSVKLAVWGTNGRISADRQECQLYLRAPHPAAPELKPGWTVKYTTDLTREVWFYLRGEEYSAQIDHFVKAALKEHPAEVNSFRSALHADRLVAMILAEASGRARRAALATASTKGLWSRVFG